MRSRQLTSTEVDTEVVCDEGLPCTLGRGHSVDPHRGQVVASEVYASGLDGRICFVVADTVDRTGLTVVVAELTEVHDVVDAEGAHEFLVGEHPAS